MAETVPLAAPQAFASKQPKRRLLSLQETPAWYEANEFILAGYRPESRSAALCFHSWTYLHNESCNIYSHLIPALLSIVGQWILQTHLDINYPNAAWQDRYMLSFHLLTAAICLGVSAHFHTFMNHSLQVAHRWLVYDYLGIITLILGDFVSGIYFGFYCESAPRRIHWVMIITLGALTAMMLVNPKFAGPQWRTFRLLSFVGTGLSAFAPIAHATVLFGVDGLAKRGVPYYLAEGALMIVASYIYERQIPERMWPGKFDIWGHSHTIFHILVALGTGVHLLGILSAFDYDYTHRSCV